MNYRENVPPLAALLAELKVCDWRRAGEIWCILDINYPGWDDK